MTQQPTPRPPSASAPDSQGRSVVLYNPDGTPMHWSEAAKHRYGLHPGSTSRAVSTPPVEPQPAPMPVVPEPAPQAPVALGPPPQPPVGPEPAARPQPAGEPAVEIEALPRGRSRGDRVPCSASVVIMVIITVLALGGAVVPFCVMNWESLEWSSWFGGSTTEEPVAAEVAATETGDTPPSAALSAGDVDQSDYLLIFEGILGSFAPADGAVTPQ